MTLKQTIKKERKAMRIQREKAKRFFLGIDQFYTPSARWWADQLNCRRRTIPRLRNRGEIPNCRIAARIMAVATEVRLGTTIPPCRVQATLPHGKSRFRGVHYHPASDLWRVVIKGRYAEYFPSEEQAGLAYNLRAVKIWGRCAYINPVPEMIDLKCECCDLESPFVFRMEWRFDIAGGGGTRCRDCAVGLRWNYDRDFYANGKHLKIQ